MTSIITVPLGGRVVLEAVAAGLGPWHGWERGTVANSLEGQEAYRARASIITECRKCGLMTAENLLTERGRKVVTHG